MIKLVAFDWNGTLLADTRVALEASNLEFEHFGHKPISLKRYRETYEIPISNYWLANGGTRKELLYMKRIKNKIYNLLYESRAKKVRTRKGAREILHWLAKHKIESVIYSNHTVSGLDFQLERLKIKFLFTEVFARTEVEGASHVHQRNKESKLAEYVKFKKFNPKQVLTIGDTCEEIEIGQKHGFYTVAITGGDNSTDRLKAAKPDFLINNIAELRKIIKKLNAKR